MLVAWHVSSLSQLEPGEMRPVVTADAEGCRVGWGSV